MKKGLLLTLVIAAMMLVSSAFSYAPVMTDIPDIVIGDIEDGATNNFFVFSDAFIFDDYVTDQDTTNPIDLKWSFKMLPGNTQVLSINGLTEEPGVDFLNPTHLLNTVPDATASFRNETLSPSTGSTPYPDPTTLANIAIAMYVSDGTFRTSQVVDVYTVNDGQDGYSGGPQAENIYTELFSTVGNWDAVNGVTRAAAPTSIASYDSANGRIVCKFPSTSLGAIYYEWEQWTSPAHTARQDAVIYQADTVYALKARMSANTNTAPGFRIRLQAQDNLWTDCLVLGATGAGQGGGLSTTADDYVAVVQPQGTTANAFLAVDIFTALNNLGEVYIDELNVYAITISELETELASSITSFTGWSQIPGGSVSATIGATNITFPDPNGSFIIANGYVTYPTAIAKGDVYRLTYSVSKSNSTARCDQLRLRANDTANAAYGPNFVYNDGLTTSQHITTAAQNFYLWHYAMNGRGTGTGNMGTDMSVAFDTIEFGISGAASTILNGVTIDKVTNWPTLD